MTDSSLYLTSTEQKTFERLSSDIREGWQVLREEETALETSEELKMRALMFRSEHPLLKEVSTAKIQTVEDLLKILHDLEKLPPEQMLVAFFSLGAGPLSALIDDVLAKAETDEDIQGVAGLSIIRHAILQSNARYPSLLSS